MEEAIKNLSDEFSDYIGTVNLNNFNSKYDGAREIFFKYCKILTREDMTRACDIVWNHYKNLDDDAKYDIIIQIGNELYYGMYFQWKILPKKVE